MKIALLAGEASGDFLGSRLIPSLKKHFPNAEFAGIAGPLMQAEGCVSWFPMDTLSVMGLFEVLKHLPALLKLRRALIQKLLAWKPDVFIGIDAPDFNLGVERVLKQHGIKTVHYVGPSVWAWREDRVEKIRAATDLVCCLFPFEVPFYEKRQVNAAFVGHPLADEIPLEINQAAAKVALGFSPSDLIVAILPGSRRQEIQRMLPIFLKAAEQIRYRLKSIKFLLPVAKPSLWSEINRFKTQLDALNVQLLEGQSHQALSACDAVLVTSGTASLEAMLHQRPGVVAYRMNPLTYQLAKRLVKVRYIGLPNILAGRMVMSEFVQSQATPDRLSAAILSLLENPERELETKLAYSALHQQLKRDASEQVAKAVLKLLEKPSCH